MLRNPLIAAVAWGVFCASAAATGRLVDVTVLDAGGRAARVYRHEGRHYIAGQPGTEYRIWLRNRSGADLLAVVSVDGVNAVSGETAGWSQGGYVLGAGQAFDVAGWRKSLERVAAFFFTRHRNSYAARTGRPDNVGVIGVAVFRRRAAPAAALAPGAPRSSGEGRVDESGASIGAEGADMPETADGAARLRTQHWPPPAHRLGTGHGRGVPSVVTYAEFERATDDPAEVVALHYDSYENLVALGAIPAPRLAVPTPFPGEFVPDPR